MQPSSSAAPHPNPLPASGEREGPAAKPWEGEGHIVAGYRPLNTGRRFSMKAVRPSA